MKCQGKKSWLGKKFAMPGPQASVPAGMGAVGVFSGPFSVCPGAFLISHSYGHRKCLGVVALVDGHSSMCHSLLLLSLPE